MLVTTSPGLVALPLGRFSVAGTIATRLIGSLRSRTACRVPSTAAAPHISNFISSILEPGFSDIPPESKVTPLPTSTIGSSFFVPPLYSAIISFASSLLPLDTESSAPILNFSIIFSVRIFTVSDLWLRPSARVLVAR